MTTMDEIYGDGSDHLVCDYCGLCITCNDCECLLKPKERNHIVNINKKVKPNKEGKKSN